MIADDFGITTHLIMSITCPIDNKRSDDEDLYSKETRPHGRGDSNGQNIFNISST